MRTTIYVGLGGVRTFRLRATAKERHKNGVIYKIEKVDESSVKFENIEHPFSYDEVRDFCRLSFCRTYHSCQGVEFDEPLTLHELGHERFTLRHLFVGLSRAKKSMSSIVRYEHLHLNRLA